MFIRILRKTQNNLNFIKDAIWPLLSYRARPPITSICAVNLIMRTKLTYFCESTTSSKSIITNKFLYEKTFLYYLWTTHFHQKSNLFNLSVWFSIIEASIQSLLSCSSRMGSSNVLMNLLRVLATSCSEKESRAMWTFQAFSRKSERSLFILVFTPEWR